MTYCKAFLSVVLPPIAVLCYEGCGCNFLINLILEIVTVGIGSCLHAFHLWGVSCCTNILCLLLPPIAACVTHGCCEFLICLILTLLGFFPGIIYAYYLALQKEGKGD